MKFLLNILLKCLLLTGGTLIAFLLLEILSMGFLGTPKPHGLPVVRMQADPDAGYRYRSNQQGYMTSGRASINSWGFRGKDWALEKNLTTKRVALLGDSYVVGQGVRDEETFSSQLEGLLNEGTNRYEVLNFGASGYDWGHELKVLEHHVLKFKPDAVVLTFFFNDLVHAEDYAGYEKLFSIERRPGFNWHLKNFARRSRVLMFLWDLWQSKQTNEMTVLGKAYVFDKTMPPAGPGQKGWEFNLQKLNQFKVLSAQHSFRPVLAIIPTPEEIIQGFRAPYIEYLRKKAKELGIESVVLIPELDGAKKWLIPYDGHFNAKGHRIAAETLAPVIRKELAA